MIDLQQFCINDPDSWRTDLMKPFSRGDYSYGTDGIMLVRVPRRPDIPDGGPDVMKLPHMTDIEAKPYTALMIAEERIEAGTPEKKCEACKGSGQVVNCKDCGGSGQVDCPTCGNEEGLQCEKCKGSGASRPYKEGDGLAADEEVGECNEPLCDGGLIDEFEPDTIVVRIGEDCWVNKALLDRVSGLPSFMVWAEKAPEERSHRVLLFRFDGGFGMLMQRIPPALPKAAEAAA